MSNNSSNRVIVKRLGYIDIIGVSIIIIILTIFFYILYRILSSLYSFRYAVSNPVIFFILFIIIMVIHELIHIYVMKLYGVEILDIKLVKYRGFPIALNIIYDIMSIKQYVASALSPQVISIALSMPILCNSHIINLDPVYIGPIWLFSFILFMFHIYVSSGDFYGILYILIKVGSMKGWIKSIIEDGRLIGFEIHA